MTDFAALLQQGHAWWFIPSAVALGALHGLEPGHSKTMMAAFIVAVRGTLAQAVLLGLAATVSHTAVVWAVAMAGLYFGERWNADTVEPVLQLVSAVLIAAVALWMMWRTWRSQHAYHDHDHPHADLVAQADDAHARAHALEIQRRFSGQQVTTGQIALFGLTGGLIPCPASITVLLLCLQLKQVALGATLVMGFSVGLAATLVASGALAAWGVHHAQRRFSGFGAWTARALFFSGLDAPDGGLHGLDRRARAGALSHGAASAWPQYQSTNNRREVNPATCGSACSVSCEPATDGGARAGWPGTKYHHA